MVSGGITTLAGPASSRPRTNGSVYKPDVGCRHDCDIALSRLQFRLRRLSGHVPETLGGPGSTQTGLQLGRRIKAVLTI